MPEPLLGELLLAADFDLAALPFDFGGLALGSGASSCWNRFGVRESRLYA